MKNFFARRSRYRATPPHGLLPFWLYNMMMFLRI